MSTQYIYLVRHGESKQNIDLKNGSKHLDTPDHDVELTENGHAQAYAAGKFLNQFINAKSPKEVMMYVSPFRRTRETKEEILKQITPEIIKEDAMLVELDFGIFNGIPKSRLPEIYPEEWAKYQHERTHYGKFFARRAGGERPLDCEARQRIFLTTLYHDMETNPANHIIIIGHGAQLSCLNKAMFNHSHEWYSLHKNPGNASIRLITIEDGKMTDRGYIHGGSEDG